MRKQKRAFQKIKTVLLVACCTAIVSSAAVFCHAVFLADAAAAEEPVSSQSADTPVTATTSAEQESNQQTEDAEATEPAKVAETTKQPVEQEIDGQIWMVRQELPIVRPSLSPERAQDVSIVVNKSDHVLTLYNKESIIAQYSIGHGSAAGSKEQEGDKRTPEGEYTICVLNDQSKYYLSLGLNYPNANDAKRGLDTGLITQEEYNEIMSQLNAGQQPNWYTKLGGQIMIHGQKGNLGGQTDWTTGCVAVNNAVMDILWKYCKVGTKVTILP